jgi:putative endonuclease
MDKWFVYIISTDKNTLYTGVTTDVKRRFQEHCDVFDHKKNAKGAKYFRGHKPTEVLYIENMESRSTACKREIEIKNLSKQQKTKLCIEYIKDNNEVY